MVIYTNKDAAQLAARLAAERIHRMEALELYAVDRGWLARLATKLARRMEFTLTVAERHVYLTLGDETLDGLVERVSIGVSISKKPTSSIVLRISKITRWRNSRF